AGASFRVAGTDKAIGLFELAARAPGKRLFIDDTTIVGGPTWPNGCHVCEIELDPETRTGEIASYGSMNDAGPVVNPLIVQGQLDGGALQGLGQALTEHMVFDPATGQPLSASFMDYAMPRADMIASFRNALDEATPCTTNPLGVKGVGELGTI